MIQDKRINTLVVIVVVFALMTSIALVGLGSRYADGTGNKTKAAYATRIFGTDIISIEIIADEADWQEMLDNAIKEQFIMVDVVVNGTKFQNVGIRPKGNSSLSTVASSNSDRYSFRLQFDEYIKDQTCFGLDGFVINNMLGDNTYMKEYMSYTLMKEIGVDAPYFGFADIKVNGENWGLYLAVETYGDSYEARTFGTTSGMMYNVKSMDMGGRDDDGGFSFGGMQPPASGEEGGFPQGGMQLPSFGQGGGFTPGGMQPPANGQDNGFSQGGMQPPNNGQGEQTRPDAIPEAPPSDSSRPGQNSSDQQGSDQKSSDQQSSGRQNRSRQNSDRQTTRPNGGFFGAMGGFGGNGGSLKYTSDDVSAYGAIFNNVVGKGTESDYKRVITALKALNEGENLEKYFDVDQILRYLAAHTVVVNLDSYSSSMAQNYYLYENNGKVTILPWDYNLAWGGFQNGGASSVVNFPIDTPVSGVEMSDRPLINQLLSNEAYMEKYHEYLQELMTSFFTDGKWEERITQLDALIGDYVKNDSTAFCTYEEYKAAVETFKTLGNLRYQSIQGQLDGTVPSTTAEQNANPDKLISAGSLSLSTLGSMRGGNRGGRDDQSDNTGNWPVGGGFGEFGFDSMPDSDLMMQVMQILTEAGGTVTDDVEAKLLELGLTEEQISFISQFADSFGQMSEGMQFPGGMQMPGGNMQQFPGGDMPQFPGGDMSQFPGGGMQQIPGSSTQDSGDNTRKSEGNTKNSGGRFTGMNPMAGNTSIPSRGPTAQGTSTTQSLLIYLGLFVLVLLAAFIVARKKRSY